MKIHGLKGETPFCHHVAGHRRIDAPREEKKPLALASHRQSPWPESSGGIDVSPLTYLDHEDKIGRMDVDHEGRKMLLHRSTYGCRHAIGVEWKTFIRTSCFDLE